MRNLLIAGLLSLCATSVHAATVDVNAEAAFFYRAQAFNDSGAAVDPVFASSGSIFASTSETRIVENTFESLGSSETLRLDNTSSDFVTIEWITNGFAQASVQIFDVDTIVAPTSFEVTSFAGISGDVNRSAFASVIGSYACSASDLADPGIFCDGFSDGSANNFGASGSITLAPGDFFEVTVETAPLIIVSTEPIDPIPLPAGGVLLLSGLLGLTFARKAQKRA